MAIPKSLITQSFGLFDPDVVVALSHMFVMTSQPGIYSVAVL